MTCYIGNLYVNSKQLVEMRRLDVKRDLSVADLVLTRHPKSESTFAHRSEIFASLRCLLCFCLGECLIVLSFISCMLRYEWAVS